MLQTYTGHQYLPRTLFEALEGPLGEHNPRNNYRSMNDSVTLGSAVVSTAVFGVSPKTSASGETPPNGDRPTGVLAGRRDTGQSDRDGRAPNFK